MQPKVIYSVGSYSDMFYRIGINIPDPFFYFDFGDKQYVFLDHREYGVFEEHNTNDAITLVLLNPLLEKAMAMDEKSSLTCRLAFLLFQEYDLSSKEIQVPTNFPLDLADYLRAKGMTLIPTAPLYPQRLYKTKEEAGYIREALGLTYSGYECVEDVLRASTISGDTLLYEGNVLTSEFLSAKVEQTLLSRDLASECGMIVSCGSHAAIPHHRGAGPIRPHQTIICDLFPRHRKTGYFSDITRTFVKGTVSDEIKKMYDAVYEAQTTAVKMIKPGVERSDVHQACIDIFLARGYHAGDKGFTHGTGHGLGIDLHEAPYVRGASEVSGVFEPGHVVTVEPGLYYPEIGGIRIEDVVWVTEDGNDNLTTYHKDYHIA